MLPATISAAEFDAAVKDDARWRPAARAIFSRHGITEEPRRLGGSMLVYAAGARVLKLSPPVWSESLGLERAVLETVAGRLGEVASPDVTAHGEIERWPYFLMTEIPGRPLEPGKTNERAARGVGELLARLHECPAPSHPGLTPPGGWPAFLEKQAATCLARQRGFGLPEPDIRALEGLLPDLLRDAQAAARAPHALLHTEIGPDHVHFDDEGRPVGVLDFGDALVGPRIYDAVAAGLFVTRGDPALFAKLCRAAGLRAETRTLFALTVLHRYSNLPWYLRETGKRDVLDLATSFGA